MKTKSRIFLVLTIFLFAAKASSTDIPNAPHDQLLCTACHTNALPSLTNRNLICIPCHDGSIADNPQMASHTDFVISKGNSDSWAFECLHCHDPHLQSQLIYHQADLAALFLVNGVVTTDPIIDNGDTTTFDYILTLPAPQQGWQDPASWGTKSDSDRGLIFVANKNHPDQMFEILAATGSTITVSENVDPSDADYPFIEGREFGLLYGQMIKSTLETPTNETKSISFFNPYGGFVEQDGSPEGICQVCHSTTKHWSPNAPPGDDHFASERCSLCHTPPNGFSPTGPLTGKHQEHLAINDVSCTNSDCHNLGNLRDTNGNILFNDAQILNTTVSCDSCHNDAATGPAQQDDYKVGWPDSEYDLACDGCHQAEPTTGAHTLHVNRQSLTVVNCADCHDNTVSGSTPPAQHVDGNIDVFDTTASDLGYPIDKAPGSVFTDCNNAYCHSNGKGTYYVITWQNNPASLQCNSCHGLSAASGAPDYDNTGPDTELANNHETHSESGSCFYCHDGVVTRSGDAIVSGSTGHINNEIDIAVHSAFNFNNSFNYAGDKTCTNTTCHSLPVKWGEIADTVTANCGVCHQAPPISGGEVNQPHNIHFGISTTPDTYGAQHVASTQNNYGFYCGICHQSSPDGHQNDPSPGTEAQPKHMEIVIPTAAGRAPNTPAYSTAGKTLYSDPGVAEYTPGDPIFYYGYHAGTCTDIYCHSDGAGGNPNVLPTWESGVAGTNCTYCHNNDTASGSAMSTGSHNKHIDDIALGCVACHIGTVSDNRTIQDHTKHISNYFSEDVDGNLVGADTPAVDVDFGGINGTSGSYSSGTCSNLYCHSDGTGLAYQSPTWGSGNLDCSGCHGTDSADGRPDYANGSSGKANSHRRHVFTCNVCHAATTTDGATISNPTNHINGAFNVTPGSGYDFIYSYSASGSTCSDISCHPGADATWGVQGSVDCSICHLGTGDTESHVYGDQTQAIISNSQWYLAGHGRANGTYSASGNTAAGLSCHYCHDRNVTHGGTTNPFRLANISTGDGVNGNCLICHKTGAEGYNSGAGLKNATAKVDAGHFGGKHVDNAGGLFCWDCHDAHGDTNIFMVQDAVSKSTTGEFGIPVETTTVTFVNNVGGRDYAAIGAGNGICQACHTTTDYYRADGLGLTHYRTKCIGCHKHDNDFGYGAAQGNTDCESCHGHDTDYEYSPGLFSQGAGTAASHSSHTEDDIDDFGGPNLPCSACHDTNVLPYFKSGADENGDGWFELSETNICESCHQDGNNNPPVEMEYRNSWNSPYYPINCDSCHGYPPAYDNGFPKSNSHMKHAVVVGYVCEICHYNTTTNGFTITGPTNHTNGTFNVDSAPGDSFTYEQGGTCRDISCHGDTDAIWGNPASVDCSACHLDIGDLNNYTYNDSVKARINIDQWSTSGHGLFDTDYSISGNAGADLTCAYCHDGNVDHNSITNPFRLANISGNDGMNTVCLICHKTDSTGYNPGIGLRNSTLKIDAYHFGSKHTGSDGGLFCWDCHDPHGDDNIFMIHDEVTRQSDGIYGLPVLTANVIFTDNSSGIDYAQSDPGPYTGLCNVCHTDTDHYSSTFGDGHNTNTACTVCHTHNSGFIHGGDNQQSCGSLNCHDTGKHTNHLDLSFTCDDCHNLNAIRNGYGDILFKDGNILSTTTSCSTCHQDGRNSTPVTTDFKTGWNQPVYDLDCSGCHAANMSTASHPIHLQVTDCSRCHDGTVDSVTAPEQHIDSTVDVYDITPGDMSYPQDKSLASPYADCSNIYCHSDGTAVATNNTPQNTSPIWGSGPLACSACHAYPPLYDNGTPKANSHAAHAEFTCNLCHAATTATGNTITDPAQHADHDFDLVADVSVSFTYSYDAGGGTCSTISCHGDTDAQWGGNSCLGCHAVTQNNRAPISSQFTSNSHHVQGITLTSGHCYQCHWEANIDGSINVSYHGGILDPDSAIDLVIYGTDQRPLSYAIDTTVLQYQAGGGRTEIEELNRHCLGCHNDNNNGSIPFSDGKSPNTYAWDGMSVDARYSQTETTAWGKYTEVTATPKHLRTKAFSAHGNAVNNEGGWDLSESWPNKRSGASNVVCYDCHNSHGSAVSGTTTSYTSDTSNGGILKDTTFGGGGYAVTYKPVAGGTSDDKNEHNAGAALCFDCHLTADGGTEKPWGFQTTFGASQPILGYFDSQHLTPGDVGSQLRYAYKNLPNNAGGHFGASSTLKGLNGVHDGNEALHQINGLCTPCHDPHGVSPTLTTNQQYGVPLLKGTWLTSPYKEDVAPKNNVPGTALNEGVQYHLDQSTISGGLISENSSQFAGLCLNCHLQDNLTDGAVGGIWASVDRVHESVKGWGENTKHNYPCSKCHTPHIGSVLPRLMVTNCLDSRHKGWRGNNPVPITSASGSGEWDGDYDYNCYGVSQTLGFCGTDYDTGIGAGSGRFPGSYNGSSPGNGTVICHEGSTDDVADQSWNDVTQWSDDSPAPPQMINLIPEPDASCTGVNCYTALSWNATSSPDGDAVHYFVEVDNNADFSSPEYYSANYSSSTSFSFNSPNEISDRTWYWRVRARDVTHPDQVSIWSSIDVFTQTYIPQTPTRIVEPDLECASECLVSVGWYAVTIIDADPAEYYVEIDDNSNFSSPEFVSDWIQVLSYEVSLPTETSWYWHVKVRDSGHTHKVSDWSYTDNFLLTARPARVSLTLEPDAQCAPDCLVTLEWNPVTTPDGDPVEYLVQIDSQYHSSNVDWTIYNRPDLQESGWISGSSWSVTLDTDKSWWWHVKARDSVHTTMESTYWSNNDLFLVTGNPSAPTLIAEPDTVCLTDCPVTLVWNTVSSLDGDPIEYFVQVDNNSDFSSPEYTTILWVSGTNWEVPPTTGNIWYWRVQARDQIHNTWISTWSTADFFAMARSEPPPAPTVIPGPDYDSGCANTPVTVSWNPVASPTGNPVQYMVSTDNYGNSGWLPAGQTSWSFTNWAGWGVTWQVKARDALFTEVISPLSVADYFYDIGSECWSGSCPLIFSWDGNEYSYVTDIQGPVIGLPPTALKKSLDLYQPSYIVLDNLAPDNENLYRIKIRESLPEITYLDEVKLWTVDYPASYEIATSSPENTYNYGYVNPFTIYTVHNPVLPVAATDRDNNDILAYVVSVDNNPAPVTPTPPSPDFYTFDFGTIAHPENTKLLIEGWAFYGESQKFPSSITVQPSIQVMDENGEWIKIKDIGTPSGDLKTIVYSLGNVFPTGDHRIRINMGIRRGSRWMIDRIRLDDSQPVDITVHEVDPSSGDLQMQGVAIESMSTLFSRIIASDVSDPVLPDALGYGSFTRYGEVGELLMQRDDMFVIMRHGDKLDLTFSPPAQPEQGMQRGFILKANLYYKTFSVANTVEPLPFHDMSIYPYEFPETYPQDQEHLEYINTYNTREYDEN